MENNNGELLDCYFSTIDNGGPIYCINIYSDDTLNIHYVPNDSEITISCQELRHSDPQAEPKTKIPHALLLKIKSGIYAYICDRIELFRFSEPITYFRSIEGNSSVPYGFAKTANYVISFNHSTNDKISSIIAIPNNKFSDLTDDEAINDDILNITEDSPNVVKNVKSQVVHHNRMNVVLTQEKYDSVLAQVLKGTVNVKQQKESNYARKMAGQVFREKYPNMNETGLAGNVASLFKSPTKPVQPITKWGTNKANIQPLYTPPTIQNNYISTTGTNIPLTPFTPETPKKSSWWPFGKGGKKKTHIRKSRKVNKKHKKTRKH